ncbi:MAG: sigma-70 family RNA polymerase sigma factor [Deltaproteobacteria bacterium]|nr:sigma-70 family RNA polymerase sigma factor [Deltaproteobacteria bacterium]
MVVPATHTDVSRLLLRWRAGDELALDALMPLVYQELRALAGSYLRRERPDHTLQPTALVHEAYFRLVGKDHPQWNGRGHFFTVAAQVMRRILIDHARTRGYAKRGGGAKRLTLDDESYIAHQRAANLLALDDALTALGELDASLLQLVELRFFAGLSIAETAEVLSTSISSVKREWRTARAWLQGELDGEEVSAAESSATETGAEEAGTEEAGTEEAGTEERL